MGAYTSAQLRQPVLPGTLDYSTAFDECKVSFPCPAWPRRPGLWGGRQRGAAGSVGRPAPWGGRLRGAAGSVGRPRYPFEPGKKGAVHWQMTSLPLTAANTGCKM